MNLETYPKLMITNVFINIYYDFLCPLDMGYTFRQIAKVMQFYSKRILFKIHTEILSYHTQQKYLQLLPSAYLYIEGTTMQLFNDATQFISQMGFHIIFLYIRHNCFIIVYGNITSATGTILIVINFLESCN